MQQILTNGCTISSSGTTGTPKEIFRTPENIKACNEIAIDAQQITAKSRVYTCTRMTHAGGLLLQTLPAFTLGCDVKVTSFNAFKFIKEFSEFTHTFLPPKMCQAVMQTKAFATCDLSDKIVASDCVDWESIKAFVRRGATFMANWGMSEIGPIVINIEFDSMDKVQYVKERTPDEYTIMGDTYYCDWKNNKKYSHMLQVFRNYKT